MFNRYPAPWRAANALSAFVSARLASGEGFRVPAPAPPAHTLPTLLLPATPQFLCTPALDSPPLSPLTHTPHLHLLVRLRLLLLHLALGVGDHVDQQLGQLAHRHLAQRNLGVREGGERGTVTLG